MKVIQDAGEKPLVLYSDVHGPLAGLSFLQRALAMAELSMIAYNDQDEARRAGEAIGFPSVQKLDRGGTQAYAFRNEFDCVIAFSGTDLTEWNDIEADIRSTLAMIGTLGRVHSGFRRELDDIWPVLSEVLAANDRTLYFCGHSLGAGIATLAAYRCVCAPFPAAPHELHTFGSPRVADKPYLSHTTVRHHRWVHNNDVIARMPPRWMGYDHGGEEVYLDRFGRIRKLSPLERRRDAIRGMARGLIGAPLDPFVDHRIHEYLKHLRAAVEQERQRVAAGPGSD